MKDPRDAYEDGIEVVDNSGTSISIYYREPEDVCAIAISDYPDYPYVFLDKVTLRKFGELCIEISDNI